MMKKAILLIVLVTATLFASAQKMRLNLYGTYVFDDDFDSYYDSYNNYNGTLKGGFMWGAGLEYLLRPQYGIELLYYRQDTHAPTYYQDETITPSYENFEVDLNYIMLGGLRYIESKNGRVDGFGGLLLGMNTPRIENPTTGSSSSAVRFAWGARLGCNIWLTDKIGIKLQAQVLSIVQGAGGGFYFGTGGAGAGVSTYSTIYQFPLGGGLVFKLGSATSENP